MLSQCVKPVASRQQDAARIPLAIGVCDGTEAAKTAKAAKLYSSMCAASRAGSSQCLQSLSWTDSHLLQRRVASDILGGKQHALSFYHIHEHTCTEIFCHLRTSPPSNLPPALPNTAMSGDTVIAIAITSLRYYLQVCFFLQTPGLSGGLYMEGN